MTRLPAARPTRRRPTLVIAFLAAATLVAAGCDRSTTTSSERTPGTSADTTPAEPDTPTSPERDGSLDEDVGEIGTAARTAGCRFGLVNEEDPEHVDDVSELDFSTTPPTSGTHYDDWAPFGRYDEPVEPGYAVHNLEHGGVVVWLGQGIDDADAIQEGLEPELDDGEKWLVTPYDRIEGIASSAWAQLLVCPPAAVKSLGTERTVELLDAWYEATESEGSPAEGEIEAFPGQMQEPVPEQDISIESDDA